MKKFIPRIRRRYLYLLLVIFVVAGIAMVYFMLNFNKSSNETDPPVSEQETNEVTKGVNEIDRPDLLLSQGRPDEARVKYQELIDRANSNEERRSLYEQKSQQCLSFGDYECAITAWQEYGNAGEKDYVYYIKLAKLQDIGGDVKSAGMSINHAHSLIFSVDNPNAEHVEIINSLKARYDANN